MTTHPLIMRTCPFKIGDKVRAIEVSEQQNSHLNPLNRLVLNKVYIVRALRPINNNYTELYIGKIKKSSWQHWRFEKVD